VTFAGLVCTENLIRISRIYLHPRNRPPKRIGLSSFGHEGSACRLAQDQQTALKDWITARLPRSTRVIGAWIEKSFALSYSRPGLIALLHRLGFDYRKPREAPRNLNEEQ
jgi:transposase